MFSRARVSAHKVREIDLGIVLSGALQSELKASHVLSSQGAADSSSCQEHLDQETGKFRFYFLSSLFYTLFYLTPMLSIDRFQVTKYECLPFELSKI